MVIDTIKTIFNLSFIISLILTIINSWNKKSIASSSKEKEVTTKTEVIILPIVVISTLVIIVGGIFLVGLKNKNLALIILLISSPLYLSYMAGTYLSVGIVRNVVQYDKENKLSVREHWAIQTISYTLFYLDVFKLPTKLLEVLKAIENVLLSDLLYVTVYMFLFFLYAFLICALLSSPLVFFARIMIKLNLIFKAKTNLIGIGDFFINKIDKNNMLVQFLSINVIEFSKKRCRLLNIAVLILSPLFIGIDICLSILKVMWGFVLETIGYIFLLLRMIKKTLGKLTIWIKNLSDRRMVAMSFRIALIATLTLTVITNRYSPLLREYESSTAVLEFVAGTILIPVIFEWISTTKKRRNEVKENN